MTTWHSILVYEEHYFNNFLELIKSTIKEEKKRFDKICKNFEKKKENMSVDELNWNEDLLSDLGFEFSETEQLLYRSLVISIFIFIEAQIFALCKHIYRTKEQIFGVEDLKGQGVIKGIKYLEKILNEKFMKERNIENDFNAARIIRNSLVHNVARVDSNNKKFILKYIQNHPNSVSLNGDEIILNKRYAEELISLNVKICKIISNNSEILGRS